MKTSPKLFLIILVNFFAVSAFKCSKVHHESDVVKNVNAFFSTALNQDYQFRLQDFNMIFENKYFDKNCPTAIYIHGYNDDGEMDQSVTAIRTAYQKRRDTNFIAIDWQYYSKCFYYKNRVIPQLKIICKSFAKVLKNFFDLGYDVKNLHLIGHSLGGQCIGLASRTLKKISNYTIPRLYALDPAGPGFEEENSLTKILDLVTFKRTKFGMISKDDAKYVQIIHTNGGKYGIMSSRGHADFFPNNGKKQAGCERKRLDDVCSHRKAWVYYQESVNSPNPFLAVKCASYEDFKNGKCDNNKRAIMGYSNDHEEGNFYLITNPNPLFPSLGKDGLKYKIPEYKFEANFDSENSPKWEETDDESFESDITPSWGDSDIEYEELLVFDDDEIIEETSGKIQSALEVIEDDFKYIEDSNGCLKLNHTLMMILGALKILKMFA